VEDVTLAADEILGIPAGFLEAGVKSVLVSIPQAEGRAARAFTTHYHGRRLLGEPPLASFRSAQQYMLDSGAPAHTWAGFAIYGFA
jgi:CHAT domain-containing protein